MPEDRMRTGIAAIDTESDKKPNRWRNPVTSLRSAISTSISQGISPRKLAFTVTLGVVIGAIPMVWGATLICAVAAFRFKLNHAVIQAVNYLTYPLQIAMFVPFYRAGTDLFPWGPAISPEALLSGDVTTFSQGVAVIVIATLKALAAWLFVAIPASGLLYCALLPLIQRLVPGSKKGTLSG